MLEFALDHAIVKMPPIAGRDVFLRQCEGIPMGDPISPALCIGATGFMEDDFMSELTPAVKKMFRAKRYMDDILILYVENENWDHERFLADFERSASVTTHRWSWRTERRGRSWRRRSNGKATDGHIGLTLSVPRRKPIARPSVHT